MAAVTPANNNMVPASGPPRMYQITKTFDPNEPVIVDFRQLALDGSSFIPYGVYIDCTDSEAGAKVIINEAAFAIIAGPGQQVHSPYPAPMNQSATIIAEGRVTVIFVDYPVFPFVKEKT